jgi:D-beta-D-heptose 7-phosphate kinase / D-beta-D-heptose 1-phosphate adenosyltransferase
MRPLVIIGDSMLDVDVDGSASRLSPEAPVPVVEPDRIWHRPGGAGLAAVLAARVYPDVVLITATADDPTGRTLAELFVNDYPGIRVSGIPLRGGTVSKIRIRAGGQSVVRVDHGDGYAADEPLPDEVAAILPEAAAICVADYGRGVAGHEQLRALLGSTDVPVVWDPHPRGACPTPGCALVSPNQAEAKQFSPSTANNVQLAATLRTQWQAAAVSVTLGARGAMFADQRHSAHHIVAPETAGSARSDACGAGDRFSVAAAIALSEGADELQAATTAVAAASRFVAAGGAAAVSSVMPMPGGVGSSGLNGAAGAVTGMDSVIALAERVRRSGGSLVATGGCFDLLHTGHVRLLRRARDLGDALVVLINSDESVRAIKGAGRPVVPAEDRARVLAALGCVDGVAIFSETSPAVALERLQPDIWVKGGDYTGVELPEADVVRRHGGEVVLLATVPGYSSSKLIAAAR